MYDVTKARIQYWTQRSNQFSKMSGVYTFHMNLRQVGEKIWWLIKKNANIRGKRWKKGGIEEKFSVLGEKIWFFEKKKVWGQKYQLLCSLESIINEEIIERSIFIYFLYEERSIFELLFVLISDLIYIDDPLLWRFRVSKWISRWSCTLNSCIGGKE